MKTGSDTDSDNYLQEPIQYTEKELVEAIGYCLKWLDTEFEPSHYIYFPEIEYDGHGSISGYLMHAGTDPIHRNDPGKKWKVGLYKSGEECIVAMARLLPTVNTESDY